MHPLLTRLRVPRLHRVARWRQAPVASCAAVLLVMPIGIDYVVKPGDTVWGIARAYDSTVRAIVRANDLEHRGTLIYPGDVLRIPAAHKPSGRTKKRPIAVPQASHRRPLPHRRPLAHPDKRRIVVHTVKRGDTVGAIAARYHAWTDEVIKSNRGSTMLQVGQRLRVPVVVRAVQEASRAGQRVDTEAERRAAVRRLIAHTARRHGVDPQLALAVSWQESGWQQDVVSHAHAIGAMQVIPSTGRWMSQRTGRDLRLRKLEDNVFAGVVLLRFLTDRESTRRALAGYYQGLGAVHRHGLYDETKRYVANVLAIKRAFERGDYPY